MRKGGTPPGLALISTNREDALYRLFRERRLIQKPKGFSRTNSSNKAYVDRKAVRGIANYLILAAPPLDDLFRLPIPSFNRLFGFSDESKGRLSEQRKTSDECLHRPNETQDQVRLAVASVNCNGRVEITKWRGTRRPDVSCIAWLGAWASGNIIELEVQLSCCRILCR